MTSDVSDQLDRLMSHGRDRLVVAIVTQHGEALAFCGSGDQQVHRPGRPVHSAFCQQLLDFVGALADAVRHRRPAEQVVQQPLLSQPIGQRSRGIEELQLDDRAYRDDAGGELVRPCLPQPVLQDAEQSRGVN